MNQPPICPDCQTEMEQGFIPDFSYGSSLQSVVQTLWHPGDPTSRTFLGLQTGTVQFDASAARKVVTYCCPDCGLLRSYAEPH